MHASSYEQPPKTPKYSHITLPFKNLFGGVEESHTKEQMPQISAEMEGCGRRSKITAKSTKNTSTARKSGFLEEERECGIKIPVGDAWWAQAPWWCGKGRGRALWPPGPGVAPLVSLRCPWVSFYAKILIFIFLEFF